MSQMRQLSGSLCKLFELICLNCLLLGASLATTAKHAENILNDSKILFFFSFYKWNRYEGKDHIENIIESEAFSTIKKMHAVVSKA